MKIYSLTPDLVVAGRAYRLKLRPRDALAWQAVAELTTSQQASLLANSPELLVMCLAHLAGTGMSNHPTLDELTAQLRSTTQTPEAGTVTAFDIEKRKTFVNALAGCDGSATGAKETAARLQELILNACQLDEDESKAISLAACLTTEVWLQLGQSAKSLSQPVRVKLSHGQHPVSSVQSDPEFQRLLQLEKLASMKQLAYGASHEINNPLANIASRAQTLLMDEKDPGRRLKLAKINEQAFRAHEMIADMMLFAHPPKPEFTITDPLQVVRAVIEEMRPLAERQQTAIRLHEGHVISGGLDATQLAVAVKAIVQNSLESLQESGTVEVDMTSPDNDSLFVTISDDGPGIDPQAMQHLFDPFYSGREAGRGLGFGLSKAWRIAELHGGEISAESPPHGGARFCLRIPYREVA